MVKKAILIYDARSGKLTQVCDVRDLELAKFDNFKKEAKENIKAIIKEQDEREAKREEEHQREISNLKLEINSLKLLIANLYGFVEFEESDIKKELGIPEEEQSNEQTSETD